MGNKFAQIAFTDSVREVQTAKASRSGYSSWDEGEDSNQFLGEREAAFIAERAFVIDVEAFDWNCPQHITPRYTESQMNKLMESLVQENSALKAENALLQPKSINEHEHGELL